MAKIRVDVGVYLPSNPDGVVVDIDKKSGRPLQSHAKVDLILLLKHILMLQYNTGPIHGDFQSAKGTN